MTSRQRVASRVGVAVLAAGLLAGCVTPALTTDVYEAKAQLSAEDALSSVSTAVLSTRTFLDDDLPGPYLETVLVDAETAVGAVQATFDSIQPPDTEPAERLRADLDQLLDDGAGGLTDLRIAARRGERTQLASVADSLDEVATALEAFAEEHSR